MEFRVERYLVISQEEYYAALNLLLLLIKFEVISGKTFNQLRFSLKRASLRR